MMHYSTGLSSFLIATAATVSVSGVLAARLIPDSQIVLRGDDFIGSPATPHELDPKLQFQPPAALMHGDGANTGSSDFAGPLADPKATVNSATTILGVMLWGPDGSISGGRPDILNKPTIGLGAYDPETLDLLADWFPSDPDEYLNLGYMEIRFSDNSLLISGTSGRLYVVQREGSGKDNTTLTLTREIDVSDHLVSGSETLLNSLFDSEGNIWFTTGALPVNPPQNSCSIGYVEPGGKVHVMHLPDQIIENGVSLDGTTAYVVTGPLNGTSTTTTGYIWAVTTATNPDSDGIQIVWRSEYDAGTHQKDGGLTRGGGGTPSLLGRDFVTTTDNADEQINLLVLHRDPQQAQQGPGEGEEEQEGQDQIFCKVPLFEKGKSSNDIRPTVHYDNSTGTYGVLIQNGYKMPPMQDYDADFFTHINGDFNDMTVMPGGMVRVEVDKKGGSCEVKWENDIPMKSVPALSTKTGLLYGYLQDLELAAREGKYVWYFAALDWETGEVVWKKRSGAGGSYNDNAWPGSIGEGKFYQSLMFGTAWVEDERGSSSSRMRKG